MHRAFIRCRGVQGFRFQRLRFVLSDMCFRVWDTGSSKGFVFSICQVACSVLVLSHGPLRGPRFLA